MFQLIPTSTARKTVLGNRLDGSGLIDGVVRCIACGVTAFLSAFFFRRRLFAITTSLTDICTAIPKLYASRIAPTVARIGVAIALAAIRVSAALFLALFAAFFFDGTCATIICAILAGLICPAVTISTKGFRLRTVRLILSTGTIVVIIAFPGTGNALAIITGILIRVAAFRLVATGFSGASPCLTGTA